MDEAQVIARCQAGDEGAFGALMERYQRVLYGTAYAMTRDHGQAEDAVQEALLAAWQGIPSFHVGNNFKVWLVRVLVNRTKNLHRKKRVETAPLEEAVLMGNSEEAADVVLREEERQMLQRGLETLPEEQRQTVTLRYYAGLTVPEIAKALGCREGTVKSRLHRAVDRLRCLHESAVGRP